MATNYAEKLQEEIEHVPAEHLPALLTIVHSFRESVSLKTQQDEAFNERIKQEAMRISIIEGEQSGDSTAFNMREIINEAKQESGLNASN